MINELLLSTEQHQRGALGKCKTSYPICFPNKDRCVAVRAAFYRLKKSLLYGTQSWSLTSLFCKRSLRLGTTKSKSDHLG